MSAKLIEVIETDLERRGRGEQPSPVRSIKQFWSKDGKLLAEVDSFALEKEREERAQEIERAAQILRISLLSRKEKTGAKTLTFIDKNLKELAERIRSGNHTLVNMDAPGWVRR